MICKCGKQMFRNGFIPTDYLGYRNYTCRSCGQLAKLLPRSNSWLDKVLFDVLFIGQIEWTGKVGN